MDTFEIRRKKKVRIKEKRKKNNNMSRIKTNIYMKRESTNT